MYLRFLNVLLLSGLLAACASTGGMQQRFAVCNYDHAWEAALDAVKDRSISTKDKDAGLVVTDWLEIPMPGLTFGAFKRQVAESKDRSRITVNVKRMDDVTKISFLEQRERWAFRGGSRLFGWTAADPTEAVMRDVQNRLDAKLKEHGCSLS